MKNKRDRERHLNQDKEKTNITYKLRYAINISDFEYDGRIRLVKTASI